MPIYKPWDTTLNNADDVQLKADIAVILTEILQSSAVKTSSDGYWDFSTFKNKVGAMSYLKVFGTPFTVNDYLIVSLDGTQAVLCGDVRYQYIQEYYLTETIPRPVMQPIVINNPQTSFDDPSLTGIAPPVLVVAACATYLTDTAEGFSSDIIVYPEVVFGFQSVTLDIVGPVPDFVRKVRYYLSWGLTGFSDAVYARQLFSTKGSDLPYSKLKLAAEVSVG